MLYNIFPSIQTIHSSFFETSNRIITIVSGYYTPNQIAQILQTSLNANNPKTYNYTVSYSSITSKCTVSCATSFSIPDSSLGQVMGYTLATSSGTSLIADSITTLNDPSYMYLDLSCFASTSYTSSDIRTSFLLVTIQMKHIMNCPICVCI
jgi:hypothetical protein